MCECVVILLGRVENEVSFRLEIGMTFIIFFLSYNYIILNKLISLVIVILVIYFTISKCNEQEFRYFDNNKNK